MAAHDAGIRVTCPGCGETTLQKAMIPLLADDGHGIGYICPTCARKFVVSSPEGEAEAEASG